MRIPTYSATQKFESEAIDFRSINITQMALRQKLLNNPRLMQLGKRYGSAIKRMDILAPELLDSYLIGVVELQQKVSIHLDFAWED